MEKIYKYRKIILVILIAVLVLLMLPVLSKLTVDDILNYKPQSVFVAVCALIGLFCLKSVTIVIPLAVLFASAGLMFGKAGGVMVSYVGLLAELTIGYVIGGYLGSEKIKNFQTEKIKIVDTIANAESLDGICFIIRVLPGPLPLDVMSMIFGAFKMKYWNYLFFSLLGLSPGMIPWVFAGSAINNPLSPEFLVPFAIGIIIAAAMFIAIRVLERKKNGVSQRKEVKKL